jgi:hypothetical protein
MLEGALAHASDVRVWTVIAARAAHPLEDPVATRDGRRGEVHHVWEDQNISGTTSRVA